MFVCANDQMGRFMVGPSKDPEARRRATPRDCSAFPTSRSNGIFAAVDMRTNKIVWRQRWKDSCYSGSTATAGDIVFTGRNDGRFVALDSRSGDVLWEFQTGAGVNATASVSFSTTAIRRSRSSRREIILPAARQATACGCFHWTAPCRPPNRRSRWPRGLRRSRSRVATPRPARRCMLASARHVTGRGHRRSRRRARHHEDDSAGIGGQHGYFREKQHAAIREPR